MDDQASGHHMSKQWRALPLPPEPDSSTDPVDFVIEPRRETRREIREDEETGKNAWPTWRSAT
jgi:hypothetical protein